MIEENIISGTVEDIIFFNESNSYAVFEMFDGKNALITCTGCVPYLKVGEILKVTGNWTVHPDYGEQFKISSFEKLAPSSQSELLSYLSSGVIRGIREATARKIVSYFGEDTLNIIADTPQRLAEINGISLKKALSIGEAYSDIRSKESLIIFLHKFGISTTFAVKIYEHFGDDAVEVIKKNPYLLCEQVRSISFKTADNIAQSLGLSKESPKRIEAGIKYVLLYSSYSGGHTHLPRKLLIDVAEKTLSVSSLAVENSLVSLLIEGELVSEVIEEEEAVFLPEFYEGEKLLAENILRMVKSSEKQTKKHENKLKEAEKSASISLSETQRKAVLSAISSGITVITGGPGTGKTTTLKVIIDIFKNEGKKIALCAPTGRAAKRMTAVTGMEAKTIHRLLEVGYSDDDITRNFVRNRDFPLDYNVYIIDEVSMIDALLMNALVLAIRPSAKLILVGDADQLPSVGAGNVLFDIIESNKVPVITLDTIFRQAEESMIVVNAHRINSGIYPEYNTKDKDFFFVEATGAEAIASAVCSLVSSRLPKAYGFNPTTDIQVLSPMKKSPAGVNNLNQLLQGILNPKKNGKAEKEMISRVFRVGDKVMQTKNNYDIIWQKLDGSEEGTGIFNGDMGYIEEITDDEISVIFDDDKRVIYKTAMTDELTLSYAITVHKSQGCEFPVVVMPIFSAVPRLMSRNLLYTAITRAIKLVVLVGNKSAINKMVDNDFEEYRYSSLKYFLEG